MLHVCNEVIFIDPHFGEDMNFIQRVSRSQKIILKN